MIFSRDGRIIKKRVEEYVTFLRSFYDGNNLSLQELCNDAGIQLLQDRFISNAWAFQFEDGPRGVVYDPTLPTLPLFYTLTKKVSHHLLRHFEREAPIYLAEQEAHYFAAALLNTPLLTLRCIHAPKWYSLFITQGMIKNYLTDHYSLQKKPILL